MKARTRTLLLPAALFASACGLHDLGVQSIEFALAPVPVDAWPDGVAPDAFVGLPLASGTVSVDVPEGRGEIAVTGLPALPDGMRYFLALEFGHHDRAALPVAGSLEGEHLMPASIGPLAPTEVPGAWELGFVQEGVAEHPLGALRAAEVIIVSDTPGAEPSAPLMAGAVGVTATEADDVPEEPTGGHEH